MKQIIIIFSFVSLLVGCRYEKRVDYRDDYMKLWIIYLAPIEEVVANSSSISIFHLWKEMYRDDSRRIL